MPEYRERVKEVITPKFAVSFDKEAATAEQLCRRPRSPATPRCSRPASRRSTRTPRRRWWPAPSPTATRRPGASVTRALAVPHRGQPGEGRRRVAGRQLHPRDGSGPMTTTATVAPSWYDVLDIELGASEAESGPRGSPPSPTSSRPTDASGCSTRRPRCSSTATAGRRTTPSCSPPSSTRIRWSRNRRRPCHEASRARPTHATSPAGSCRAGSWSPSRPLPRSWWGRARRWPRRRPPTRASPTPPARHRPAPSGPSCRSCPTTGAGRATSTRTSGPPRAS